VVEVVVLQKKTDQQCLGRIHRLAAPCNSTQTHVAKVQYKCTHVVGVGVVVMVVVVVSKYGRGTSKLLEEEV
jgi:hypothetical protein